MVACYYCNGGTRDLDDVLHQNHLHLCRYHNPMSDYNWKEDAENPEKLIDFLHDFLEESDDHDDADREEIEHAVTEKEEEYDGLVSRAAAVYLVARELGIMLEQEIRGGDYDPTHVEVETMQNCDVNDDGFGLNGIEGEYKVRKVKTIDHGGDWIRADLIIYDETGDMELTLWNDMAEKADDLSSDDVIQIEGGYVKEDDYGRGLNVAKKGRVIWPDDTETTGPEYQES